MKINRVEQDRVELNQETVRNLEALAADVLSVNKASDAFARLSFVQLGGDSLLAMQLVARAQEEFNVSLPIGSLLGGEPLRHVLARGQAMAERLTLNEISEAEATSIQQGMWVMQQLIGGSAYNLVFLVHFEGSVDPSLLRKAIEGTVLRHEGLRTGFRSTESGLCPVVVDDFVPELEIVSVVGANANFLDAVKTVVKERGQRAFALSEKPPVAFTLVTDGMARHTLLFITHHMLLDGWAIGLVLKELLDRLEALMTGKELRLSEAPRQSAFKRRQAWLREKGILARQAEYWRKALQDVPTTLELPSDRSRPAIQSPSGQRIPYKLTTKETDAVYKVAGRLGVTPFALLLSAYALLLTRYTGNRKLIVGVPSAGRSTPELRELVGLCTNVVPVIVEVKEDATVAEYVKSVQKSLSRTLDNSDIPFDELVRALGIKGDLRRNPLIQYVFGMHDKLFERNRKIGNVNVRVEDGHGGGSPFDMSLFVQYADPMLGGELEYADSFLSETEMRAFLDNYLTVIRQLVEDVEQKVEYVRGISAEQAKRLREINDTTIEYRAGCVEHLFLEQARKTPDAIAVVGPDGQEVLTYQELEHASAVQANKLLEAGVKANDFVIVAVERSIAEITAVLGVLRAGAVYVAVDPKWPDYRLSKVIEVTTPKAIIATEEVAERLSTLARDVKMAAVPLWSPEWMQEPAPILPDTSSDQDRLCYVAFTSGSTGTPKGVAIRHRGVIRLVDNVDYVKCGKGEKFLRFAPLAFDASTLEIWGPLLNGGACVIYPPELPSPKDLARFLVERGVTRLWLTSGLFRLLAEFAPEGLCNVRQLLTGGDVVPSEHVRKVLSMHPNLIVTNAYGPTENTTFTTTYTAKSVDEVEEPLPIGYPIPNTRCYVLDDRYRMVPPGGIGELFVGGDGIADGYLNNRTETERCFGKFSPDVDDFLYRTGDMVRIDTHGHIQFLGRRDQQVKIRGYRIELEEVRRAILAHDNVSDAVVVTTGTTSADRRLLAGIVPKKEYENFLDDLKNFISTMLPTYMVPAQWAVVRQIPVTANGKVDIKFLEEESKKVLLTHQAMRAYQVDNRLYAQAKELMEKVLGCTSIEDADNFFELGGDSLRMARLMAMVRKEIGLELPLKEFYPRPTLAHLVELLMKASASSLPK
ncbi:MAG: amino acid adenylation domain-containing protein [Alicyclobacillus sp.]|nr:amino acid adenylation domain-containing protein [Alicyclobacillus sp.]